MNSDIRTDYKSDGRGFPKMLDQNTQVKLLTVLNSYPCGISEYELIRALEKDTAVFEYLNSESSSLALFQKHFIVMHGLYSLQSVLLANQQYLSISPLKIVIENFSDNSDASQLTQNTDTGLRSYYLDWDNYESTDQSSVDTLMAGFWARYLADDKRLAALKDLSLPPEANWSDVKLTYRRLAAKHHPDKGGNPVNFRRVREAYETLSKCLPVTTSE